MTMDTNLTNNTLDIICPDCLHKHSPSEIYKGDTDNNHENTWYECSNCKEYFGIEKNVVITYTTWEISTIMNNQ